MRISDWSSDVCSSDLDDDAAYLNYEVPQDSVDGLFLRDVQRALYSLPADQREVLLLVGLEELTYQEAAQVLAVPRGTVMSRLSRAQIGRTRCRERVCTYV